MAMIKITDTTLRDGHQSLLATRMKTEHMIPILEKHDAIGFHSLEMWGGATFDTSMRFCCDDPWDRLKEIRRCLDARYDGYRAQPRAERPYGGGSRQIYSQRTICHGLLPPLYHYVW